MASTAYAQSKNNCKAVQLTCEHLVNPLGIDASHPRLSWRLEDGRKGALQQAYQILLAQDSLELLHGAKAHWDSGKQLSSAMLVHYNGTELKPRTKYFWRVKVWDRDGISSVSAIASFETGMMGKDLWTGKWISDNKDINARNAPYFRTEFTIKKRIKSARAYVAAAGLYELSINGVRIGDHRLDPMYTRFDRRTLYVVEDVTGQLQQGANAIGVVLGNGWYNHQPLAVWNFHQAPWRARPTFCLELKIEYTDGTWQTVVSDKQWKVATGPIIYNNIYTGEHYDARLDMSGWDRPKFEDSAWHTVQYRTPPSTHIVSQQMVPVRLGNVFRPKSVTKIDQRTYVFDMGQNMAGITRNSTSHSVILVVHSLIVFFVY
ncbi:alpha-L-rhamnosidase N-terminal domain-containing protein [uncultured Sphingobacterium sp.]|uniref:alpha-L-rhamnosidase N-terminal domain-containing protein n=1 Tax=uncultured Sphingobacterium sp. TaxID=182688 RepID=UPI0025DA8DD7|nr:alpha-L-rhamnosidase N-terminal domain-containing protein [uncultured Sphingobacterium sp.]